MKKFIIMLVLIIIVGFNSIVLAEDELKLKSDSVIVIDNLTGRVLYQKNAKKRVSIASLTKIMTSIMLVSNCDIDEKITIPKQATLIGGSEAGVRVGGEVTAKDLLYSMLLPSGNDAAYTVGFYIGNGNIKNFAYLMTKKHMKLALMILHLQILMDLIMKIIILLHMMLLKLLDMH